MTSNNHKSGSWRRVGRSTWLCLFKVETLIVLWYNLMVSVKRIVGKLTYNVDVRCPLQYEAHQSKFNMLCFIWSSSCLWLSLSQDRKRPVRWWVGPPQDVRGLAPSALYFLNINLWQLSHHSLHTSIKIVSSLKEYHRALFWVKEWGR